MTPVKEKLITWWGEMGGRWGANRTVGQVHALFFVTPEPLNAEEIAATLGIARSNASNSLHELESWGLIKPVHVRGDRRQHFEAVRDVWHMFRIILDEHRRREIDPTVQVLRECLEAVEKTVPADPEMVANLKSALEFFDVMAPLYEGLHQLPAGPLRDLGKASGPRQ